MAAKTREVRPAEQSDAALAALASDPLRFVALCWPEMKLYRRQCEILLSVRDNVETFVHAANELGKTRIAAIVTIWFFASRTPARVITSSSSETQLNAILWSEIHQLISTSVLRLPFVVKNLGIKKLKNVRTGETEPLDYVIGYVTNMVENFQGHHLPNDRPRVLLVLDEASGVPDPFFDAADSWAHRKLVIGNPLSTTNFFCRHCKRGDVPDPAGEASLLRKVIHIDGLDSPNVQAGLRWEESGAQGSPPIFISGLLSYTEYRRREQTWDEVQRTTRLHGHFYEGDQAVLFPAEWLEAAMDIRRWRQLATEDRAPTAMGVDVAAGGRDNTCWTLIDRQGVFEQIVQDTPDTMQIVGRTIRLIEDYGISPSRVAIDAGGGGKQIADRLIEQGFYVLLVGFGEAADAPVAYRNRRAELYGTLREFLNPSREEGVFLLPPDAAELRQELAVLPLQYDSEGKLTLPPKNRHASRAVHQVTIRELLGRSPDRADSLVLATYALSRANENFDFIEGELLCSQPGDSRRLTDEEVLQLPDFLREIIQYQRRSRRDWDD